MKCYIWKNNECDLNLMSVKIFKNYLKSMIYNGVQSFSFRKKKSKAEALNSNVHQMEVTLKIITQVAIDK